MFSVEVDMGEFHELVGRTLDTLDDGLRKATLHAAREGAAEAKRAAFKDQTGALRRGLVARLIDASHLSAVAEIFSPEKHSIFLEVGTKPHEIWPKAAYNTPKSQLKPGQSRRGRGKGPHEHVVGRGEFLRWKDGSGTHFARMVNHPGTPAFAFMGKGYRKAEGILYRDLDLLMKTLGSIWEREAA